MKRSLVLLLLFVSASLPLHALFLPGFRAEKLGDTAGFLSSVVVDSAGVIYYTTTAGGLYRMVSGVSTLVAQVPTLSVGDSGLLGMALRDDRTAVVHYTRPDLTADILANVDLVTGEQSILATFICDIVVPTRPTSSEHHGGNPTVAPDGSVYVAIGDYGGGEIATLPQWNAGKVFRVAVDGTVTQYARGFRNPFDLSFDAVHNRVILADNGIAIDDEINIVAEGGYYGWPYTFGNAPPVDGGTPPVYVFPEVVAPTGLVGLSGRNRLFNRGYLLTAFVAKGLFYIPDVDARPMPDPIAIFRDFGGLTIDVTEGPDGSVIFGASNGIYRLDAPQRGDCNGDGLVNAFDSAALALEIQDAPSQSPFAAGAGAFAGSVGCDANGDGVVDGADVAALALMVRGKVRVVGH